MFVVQEHRARRLHFDFRIEVDGVLKSWAVPKGVPRTTGECRLAIQVEDHPLDYAGFEGVIPKGNYGAGLVKIWDKGTYETDGDAAEALRLGKIHLALNGKKLRGNWNLVRMARTGEESRHNWLILKSASRAPMARPGRGSTPAKSDGSKPAKKRSRQVREPRSADLNGLPRAEPAFIEPMKALAVQKLPSGPDWIYEVKFDGVRALGVKNGGNVALLSRAQKDLSGKYAQVTQALSSCAAEKMVLDGEIVALDDRGRSSFQLLQSYDLAAPDAPALHYYVFDALNYGGRDTTGLPLLRRKEIARLAVKGDGDTLWLSEAIRSDSARVLREMEKIGLEGVVAKRNDSVYSPGQRGPAWVKFKWRHEQEFVIGGYTPPKGSRTHFGAILVGYYDGDDLLYAGKVGTGFSEKSLAVLFDQFKKLIRPGCPFAHLSGTRSRGSARGPALLRMKSCTWLEPKLVCEVQFAEWTRDGLLRQPAFLGLRDDKKPADVVFESP